MRPEGVGEGLPEAEGLEWGVKALTLWRPWPWAIFYGGCRPKRIENRPWKPWPSIIGVRIALHAGKKFDTESVPFIVENTRFAHEPRTLAAEATHEGIIGLVTVRGFVEDAIEAAAQGGQGQESWFFGPFGWLLDDVVRLETPVKIKGAQGLWDVPAWALKEIESRKQFPVPEWDAPKGCPF